MSSRRRWNAHVDHILPRWRRVALCAVTYADVQSWVLAFIAVSRYTIGAVLEQQSAPAGPTITFPDSDPPDEADHLAQIAGRIAALGADHEFAVGLDALVAGLSSLATHPDGEQSAPPRRRPTPP